MQPSNIKRIALITAVVVCATITWATAKPWLEDPLRFSGWVVIVVPAIAVSLLAAVTGVAWALLPGRLDRVAAILASWASLIIFWKPDVWYVSALPLFLLLWYEASRRIRNDLANRRRVLIKAVLGRGLTFILLGAFLMISVGFYLLPASREADLKTISDGIQSGLEDAYDSPFVRDQLADLPPSMQNQFKSDIARSVDEWVHKWLGPVAGYVPPFLAFALFLTLWSTGFLFREIAAWAGVGIWMLLRATKFITVTEEDGKVESVTL